MGDLPASKNSSTKKEVQSINDSSFEKGLPALVDTSGSEASDSDEYEDSDVSQSINSEDPDISEDFEDIDPFNNVIPTLDSSATDPSSCLELVKSDGVKENNFGVSQPGIPTPQLINTSSSSLDSEPDSSSDDEDKSQFLRSPALTSSEPDTSSEDDGPEDRECESQTDTSEETPTTPIPPQPTKCIVVADRGADKRDGFSFIYKPHQVCQRWSWFNQRFQLDTPIASSPPATSSPPPTPPTSSAPVNPPPIHHQIILAEFDTGKLVWLPKNEPEGF